METKTKRIIITDGGGLTIVQECVSVYISIIYHQIDWVVDTPASNHVTRYKKFLYSCKTSDVGKVRTGINDVSKIVNMGDTCPKTNIWCNLLLKEVRQV